MEEWKAMHMTAEYSAQYWHQMGYMASRLEVMKEEKTWGELKSKRIEKELRDKIAWEIEAARETFSQYLEDRSSEDYKFYQGLFNGMFYASLIADKDFVGAAGIRERIAQEIKKASCYIPSEFAQQVQSGVAFAYTKGILNGREQAVNIVRGYK